MAHLFQRTCRPRFSVIEVDRNSRDGLPIRALTQALAGAPVYRTDRLGTVEMVDSGAGFARATGS